MIGNFGERATGVIVVPVHSKEVPRVGRVGIDLATDSAGRLREFGESGKPYLLVSEALDGAFEDGLVADFVNKAEKRSFPDHQCTLRLPPHAGPYRR